MTIVLCVVKILNANGLEYVMSAIELLKRGLSPMKNLNESRDLARFFEDHIVKTCILKTLKDKLWGSWQVLKGNAGIIIYQIKKEDFYK